MFTPTPTLITHELHSRIRITLLRFDADPSEEDAAALAAMRVAREAYDAGKDVKECYFKKCMCKRSTKTKGFAMINFELSLKSFARF